MNKELKSPDTFEGLNAAYQYATRNRKTEPFNLVDFAEGLFNSVVKANTLPDNYCSECLIEMDEIDNNGYHKTPPAHGCEPDFIVTRRKYRCPECGDVKWIKE